MSDRLSVRLPNWLGDTVMTVPLLGALRTAFPGSEILAAGPWVSILAGQGLADVLLVYPRAWSGRIRSADLARDFRPGTALLLPNSLEAALSARYWGAERRIGFAAGGRSWLLTDARPLPSPRRHQVDEYLLLGELLGTAADARVPRLAPPATDAAERREVRGWLVDTVTEAPGPIVGLHLGAAYGDAKIWPTERVIELVADLKRRAAMPVLLGPPETAEAARDVVATTGAVTLVGRDRPALLPAVLAEVDVVVAGDTGVAHLAAALGTPVVALFGPTDPALSAPRGPVVVLRHAVPCAPCFYRTCPIDHPCLRGITATEVAEQVMVLARAEASR